MKKFTLIILFCFAFVAYLKAQNENTECQGTSIEASDGAFTDGYNYSFTTNGTNVTATFELLESKVGLVAFAQTYNPNFSEKAMTMVEGNKFSLTFTGQTPGATFKIACKFAFAGGLATTKIFEYKVGTDCGNTLLNLPVDFENTTLDYQLVDFGGNSSEIVADPTNAQNRVVKSTKTVGAEVWAGTTIGDASGFVSAIPFEVGYTSLSVRVWSPKAGIPIRLKVEQAGNPEVSVETETNSIIANEWQTLVFDFSSPVQSTTPLDFSKDYNKVSIFFDFGTAGSAGEQTYYWDQVMFIAAEALDLPVDFESTFINYALTDFGGNISEIVADPTDAENKVVKVIKPLDAAGWSGTTIGGDFGFANPVPFVIGATTMTLRVWSPDAGTPVRIKVENYLNVTQSVETETNTTLAGQWETLVFNFANQAQGTEPLNYDLNFNKASVFMNFGTEGAAAGEKTYYFDDMEFVSTVTEIPVNSQLPVIPVDFESGDLAYDFLNFEGGELSRIANPQISGINTSAFVSQMVKNPGEVYAGTLIPLASPINFNQGKTFKVKVFMPRVGAKLLLKVENQTNGAIAFEKEATGTKANEWEELTFDYSDINTAESYQKVVLIFDLGTAGDGSANFTYLVDDIALVSDGENPATGPLPVIPVDFESGDLAYDFLNFEGGELTRIANPQVNGINTSDFVGQMVKNPGEVYAGTLIPLASPINFNQGKTFKVKVFMPRVGAKLLLKVENQTNGAIAFEKEVTGTKANEWEELTFDYSDINTSNSYQKVVLIFDLGTAGDGSTNFTYLVDDIALVSDGENPGNSQLPVIPLDFESGELKYDFLNFEGAELSRVFNPKVGGINTSGFVGQMIKYPGAVFAGTLIQLGSPIDFSEGKFFKVKVFMPRVGAKLLLKVENQTNSEIAFEKEVTGTKANEWEELTFDYSDINISNSYQKVVLIFDLGTAGDGSANFTYLVDDIALFTDANTPAVTLTQMNVPVTFDAPNVNYGLVGFGGADASSIVQDPTNAANKVARVMKSGAAELWAGTTVTATSNGVQTGFSSKIPFTNENKKLSVRVWSPDAGIPVRLKVENHLNNEESVETEASTTVAGSWETLTFDFDNEVEGTAEFNISSSYNKLSIFFNFGKTGAEAGEKTYYFDDIIFGDQVACVNPPKPVITMTGEGTGTIILTSSASEGNQWFFNGEIIPGANGVTLSVTDFGVFTVQVTVGDCQSEISDGTVLIVNGSEIRPIGGVSVYPNPTVDYVEVNGLNGALRSLEIIDMTGRSYAIPFVQIGDVYQVNMTGLSPGIYVLWIQQGNQNFRTKIIKK